MNIMFIATRAPYGRMHGHKLGIRTQINALKQLGHNVVLVAFSVPGDTFESEDLGVVTRYLAMPPKYEVVARLLTQGLAGSKSINECLYASRDVQRQINTLVQYHSIDLVIADMVRTARYADATGLPWIIDHEDLLSERYRMWNKRSSGDENILGYLQETLPELVRPFAKRAFRKLLSRESRILERRELYWTDRAQAASLRSIEETASLQRRAQRHVFCMPVTVDIPAKAASALEVRPMQAVFAGGLTYQPNLDALRAYVSTIIPEFERRTIEAPKLLVIGAAPAELRRGLDHPTIEFLGYVPDVSDVLRSCQVFFAPIVSGTGIKTKVLEALACGLPLIALPAGLAGLRGQHGREFLRAESAADFVTQYVKVKDDLGLAKLLAAAGRSLAVEHYSVEAATRVLADAFAHIQSSAAPASLQRSKQLEFA